MPTLATPRPRRRRLSVLLTAALAAVFLVGSLPAPAGASTAGDMVSAIYASINRDRVARGLVPLRYWSALGRMASDRAGRMAAKGVLSHAAAGGNAGTEMTARGIQWYTYGEAIGATGWPWGLEAAGNLYSMWMGSSGHRALLMSARFNYVGIGVAYNSTTRTTYAAVELTESRDHTGAVARNGTLSRSGTTVTFRWSGYDPRLQTHTAGLRSFDVQYRVDSGSWRTIRNDTTSTSLTLYNRSHGHTYSFRVQAADRRGNLGAWTSATRIWVP